MLERDVLVYRTYIALKRFSVVLGEVKDDAGTPEALKAVRLLASHASSTGSARESACTALSELADSSEDETTALMYATALEADGKHEDALRAVDRDVKSSKLQALALRVVVLLAMHRGDLAEQATAAMVSADDDSALTQLCLAWTHLVAGGDKLGEASLIFQDLTTRFGASALLLNGQAAALIALGSFDDAKKLLVDASSMATAGSSTTINLLALSRLTGEHDAAKRYFECVRLLASGALPAQPRDAAFTMCLPCPSPQATAGQ